MKRAERRAKTERVARRRLKVAKIVGTFIKNEGYFKKSNLKTYESEAQSTPEFKVLKRKRTILKATQRNKELEDDSIE